MNRKTILAPLALALSLGACDSMLEEEPKSFLTIDNFYQSTEDARAALLAAYETLQHSEQSGWEWMFVLEGMSDVSNAHPLDQNPPAQHPGTLSWDNQNTFMQDFWRTSNQLIYRANLGMDRIPDSPMPAAEQAVAIAELKFLRGWTLLRMEKRYGGVPLYLTVEDHENPEPVRASREEVDAQAIKDLTEAEAALPLNRPAGEWGRATKGAARMALADLYLWRSSRYATNEWDKAAEWAQKVIDSGQYRLLEDQLQVFLPSNKANAELIFVKPSTGTESRTSTTVQNAHYPRELRPGGGFGVVTPTAWSHEVFADGDYRLVTSFRFAACNLTGTTCFTRLPMGSQPFKFRPSNQASGNRGDVDIPFYRLAEAYLIRAEALNEMGRTDEAIQIVNMIRARARGGVDGAENRAEPADLPMGMGKLAARDAIYLERHYELVWEVKRWWDLVRRDTLEPGFMAASLAAHDPISISQGPVQEFRKLWPIPQRDVDVTRGSLVQNPGY